MIEYSRRHLNGADLPLLVDDSEDHLDLSRMPGRAG